jgi:hypothetical protein
MSYAEIRSILCSGDGDCPVEQWHGLLCGLVCSGRPTSVDLLNRLMIDITGLEAELTPQQIAVLEDLLRETVQQLADGQITFQLLLPDEEESLALRTQALSDWCDAFLFGLSAGGLSSGEAEPAADIGDFLTDLAEISRAGFEDDADCDDNEYYYNELVEYVRVGALLVNDECNPVEPLHRSEH